MVHTAKASVSYTHLDVYKRQAWGSTSLSESNKEIDLTAAYKFGEAGPTLSVASLWWNGQADVANGELTNDYFILIVFSFDIYMVEFIIGYLLITFTFEYLDDFHQVAPVSYTHLGGYSCNDGAATNSAGKYREG